MKTLDTDAFRNNPAFIAAGIRRAYLADPEYRVYYARNVLQPTVDSLDKMQSRRAMIVNRELRSVAEDRRREVVERLKRLEEITL